MKKSFSLIELIFVIFILTLLGGIINIKVKDNNLIEATKRLVLYLKETRYQSLLDNKYDQDDKLWHKKRWTLKFFRCSNKIGGIYYSIYSDTNKTGHPNYKEALNDPLTNKKIYSSNKCEKSNTKSKYVLLTKEYNIKNIDISCNSTKSLGQISFGNDGKVYSKLSPYGDESSKYEIIKRCNIKLTSQENENKEIIIEPKSGYVYMKTTR